MKVIAGVKFKQNIIKRVPSISLQGISNSFIFSTHQAWEDMLNSGWNFCEVMFTKRLLQMIQSLIRNHYKLQVDL
jgi:hypothetical protein